MIKYCFLLLILLSSYASGVVLTPLVEEICSSRITQNNSTKIFTAQNSTNDIVGVEVILQRVTGRQNGKELRVDVNGTVDWYPKQFILKPKSSKNFRVHLKMKTFPSKEYAYRVIVKEHPLKFTKENENNDGSGKIKPTLKMIFNYEGFLFVKKCNYKEKLEIKGYTFDKNSSTLKVEIFNSGKKSIVPSMKQFDLILKSSNDEFNLQGKFKDVKRIYPDGYNTFIIELKNDDQLSKINPNDIINVELTEKD